MKTLSLVLKRKWFDMIASGEKTEEYREIKPYWVSRLGGCFKWCSQNLLGFPFNRCVNCENISHLNQIASNGYDNVTFHLGYAKNRPSMTFAIKEIAINPGRTEWGAEKGKMYFVIKLGKRL